MKASKDKMIGAAGLVGGVAIAAVGVLATTVDPLSDANAMWVGMSVASGCYMSGAGVKLLATISEDD